jgi:hypothetical protein
MYYKRNHAFAGLSQFKFWLSVDTHFIAAILAPLVHDPCFPIASISAVASSIHQAIVIAPMNQGLRLYVNDENIDIATG